MRKPILSSDLKDIIATVGLKKGSHETLEDGMCVMEAVSWLAGESHTDQPKCTCPVLAAVSRRMNDLCPSDEIRSECLGRLPFLLIGTSGGGKKTRIARAQFLIWWASENCLRPDVYNSKYWESFHRLVPGMATVMATATATAMATRTATAMVTATAVSPAMATEKFRDAQKRFHSKAFWHSVAAGIATACEIQAGEFDPDIPLPPEFITKKEDASVKEPVRRSPVAAHHS